MASQAASGRVGRDLTQGPIFTGLLTFALPIILANVIQQLYGMVDLAVVGKYVTGTAGTNGVNIGGEMADLVLPVAMGFGTAGQIFIAQLVGAKDSSKTSATVSTLLTFTGIVSIVIALLSILFCVPILNMLNCPASSMGQAEAYMIITAIGFPFVFGYNAVCGILRGMGESKRPLIFIIIAATVNIFADILLVAVIPLEAAGTAIATVLSQIGSFAAALYYLYRSRDKLGLKFDLSFFKMDIPVLKTLLKLGLPQVARSLLVRFGLLYVNAGIYAYGEEVSAASGVGNKLQKFMEVFVQGVDTASASMIGQNLGAQKPDRAAKVTWSTLVMTMVLATATSAVCLMWPEEIFGLFTDVDVVKTLGIVYLEFMVIHFYSSAFVGTFQAMVTGCGFVSLGFAIGILDGIVCKIGLSLIFAPLFANAGDTGFFAFFCSQVPDPATLTLCPDNGYLGYFLGIACSRILPGLLCFGYFLSGKWKTRKLLVKGK